MATHSFSSLMRRLSRAGFPREFVRPAILPEWWDDTLANDGSVLPDLEIRVARFLGQSISRVRNPAEGLAAPAYPGAQLRRVRDIDRDRLGPAIHSALQIAAAVIRSVASSLPSPRALPKDPMALRAEISRPKPAISLMDLVNTLWAHGIVVVPAAVLPKPSFQGLAGIVEGRPVIVLGHRNDEPGRLAFSISHECGHIAHEDCATNEPVVDEQDDVIDTTNIERRADSYATQLLTGMTRIPAISGTTFQELAKSAIHIERETGAEATSLIYAWARTSGDYTKATMAVKALYRNVGARRFLKDFLARHIDSNAVTDSDQGLLRCVFEDVAAHETAD